MPETTAPEGARTPVPATSPAQTASVDPDVVPMIEFRGVVKRFGDNTVLDGLDFRVARGDR
ncbi:hypothetical protein ACNJFH_21690, partial [Mycobacterium tuberculosis]